MKREKKERPLEVIRLRSHTVIGLILLSLAAIEVACIFVFALRAKNGRLFLSLAFAAAAVIMAAAAFALLMNRIELYRDGFRQWNLGWEDFAYRDCASRYPVYEEDPFTRRKKLHHIELYFRDGSTVILKECELTRKFKRLLDYEGLPVMSRRD
ncbi:MAG: hypothetical protein K6G56_00900 [Clostridiales bacterium]|nr:hypothetical protein [Clostridiales bacterium]